MGQPRTESLYILVWKTQLDVNQKVKKSKDPLQPIAVKYIVMNFYAAFDQPGPWPGPPGFRSSITPSGDTFMPSCRSF